MGVVPVNSNTYFFIEIESERKTSIRKYEIRRVNVKMSAGGRTA